jgi:23S rRNA pseudouridine2605 synthase
VAERLQKLLAAAGYGSRRACETLILRGRVSIDGEIVTELGTRADLSRQTVAVDGKPIRAPKPIYLLMNKPTGYVTTMSDPHAPRTVARLLPELPAQVHPVGRLDRDTDGVLLFTNDGSLTQRLSHPRYGVEKTYRAAVSKRPGEAALTTLRSGVALEDGKTAPAKVRVLSEAPRAGRCTLEITIHEGRNRQVRRMLAAVGCQVERLTRTRVGNLTAHKLPRGACRLLSQKELAGLRRLAGLG